jgi:hypothetical protein
MYRGLLIFGAGDVSGAVARVCDSAGRASAHSIINSADTNTFSEGVRVVMSIPSACRVSRVVWETLGRRGRRRGLTYDYFFTSIQFAPTPTSVSSGTSNSTAVSISCFNSAATRSASPFGASINNSS